MRLKRLTLTMALAALALGAGAQERQTLRLSLEEAQQYAVEHNAAMQNANLEVKKAEMERWKTISSMLPQVKGTFDYQNMLGYEMEMGMAGQTIKIPLNPNGTFGVNAAVALTGAQVVGTMLQNLAVEMTDLSRQQTELQTRAQVKNVYVSHLVMQETIGLLDSSLANLERLAATSQAAVNVGAAEQVDADKLQVQVATLKSSINSTKRSLQVLKNSLLLQLGADANAELELTTAMDEILSVDAAARLMQEPFRIENNYDYQLLSKNEELSRRQVNMAWMDFLPTVAIFYQYSAKTYFGKDAGMNMTPPNMLGASVSLPIFTSGTRLANIKSARIALQETQNSRRQAEDGLRLQYNQLRYDLASALENYDIQSKNMEVTQRVFASLSEKYKYGRASSLELTQASTDIISAQSNYIQAVMNVISAQVALENLLNVQGGGVKE
ncbi:MAG: TolC family protein [Bacteroidales bacterium]|nr:TolC family protein [Bacteroidales bacterium]